MIELRGTSHVASRDLDRIRAVVDEVDPDVVALELDRNRLSALLSGEKEAARNPLLRLMQWVQDLLGRRAGAAPGSDMLAGFRAAEAHGIDVALIDRDIGETVRRLKHLPLLEKVKFAGFLFLAPVLLRGGSLDLEEVPERAMVDEMLVRLEVSFPGLYRALIEERNDVMADRLRVLEREYGEVLAFVGAAHVPGLAERLEDARVVPAGAET